MYGNLQPLFASDNMSKGDTYSFDINVEIPLAFISWLIIRMKQVPSGCETLEKLWKMCINDLKVDQPGMSGTLSRAYNITTYNNMEYSIKMAAIKCAQESSRSHSQQIKRE